MIIGRRIIGQRIDIRRVVVDYISVIPSRVCGLDWPPPGCDLEGFFFPSLG